MRHAGTKGKRARRRLGRLRRLRTFDRRFLRQGHQQLAGIDEAGCGPLAGPVVACAVVLRTTRRRWTVSVDDSKRLTAAARRRAFDEILTRASVGIGIVAPQIIDDLNIYHARLLAMRQAVACLPAAPDYLLIDGLAVPQGIRVPAAPIVHGDRRSLSIACASIVAKVVRDSLMTWYDRRHPVYGFARHKGYPTRVHLASLTEHGPSPIHRRSFAPVARAVVAS